MTLRQNTGWIVVISCATNHSHWKNCSDECHFIFYVALASCVYQLFEPLSLLCLSNLVHAHASDGFWKVYCDRFRINFDALLMDYLKKISSFFVYTVICKILTFLMMSGDKIIWKNNAVFIFYLRCNLKIQVFAILKKVYYLTLKWCNFFK